MYYKNIRRLANGRRVSQFIDGDTSFYKRLNYKPNGITKAPKNSNGIYCYDSLERAKRLVNGNTSKQFTGIVEIHEARPVGEPSSCPFGDCFPAIILGKTVGRYRVVNGCRRLRCRLNAPTVTGKLSNHN